MKLFGLWRRSTPYRSIGDRMGKVRVIDPGAVRVGRPIGPGILIADLPNFEEIARKQIAAIESLPTFHQSATSFFFPEMEDACYAYCRELRGRYEGYKEDLDTTYRNGLISEKERICARLTGIGFNCAEHMNANCSNQTD